MASGCGEAPLGDPVIDHVPAFEMYDPWVTRAFMIEDLMAERSGMSPYAGDLLAVIGYDAPYIQAQIRHMPPVSSFRSRFGYVNNLFLVAAEVIKRHTGMTWRKPCSGTCLPPRHDGELHWPPGVPLGRKCSHQSHDVGWAGHRHRDGRAVSGVAIHLWPGRGGEFHCDRHGKVARGFISVRGCWRTHG